MKHVSFLYVYQKVNIPLLTLILILGLNIKAEQDEKRKTNPISGQDSGAERPWAHLFPQAQQNYTYLQSNYRWKNNPKLAEMIFPTKYIKKEPQQDGYEGQKCGTVKTHTPGQATCKWKDDHNCRGSPQEARDPNPTSGFPNPGILQQKDEPQTSGFKGQ